MSTTWIDRLREAADRHGQREVAARMGLSQTTISLVLTGKYPGDASRVQAAFEAAFGNSLDWLGALRAECERTSQARVAVRIGVSPGTVSQVLSGNYGADTARIARRVRGALLGETVECPVALEMPLHKCQEIQERKAGAGGNPIYARAQLCCRGIGPWADAGPCRHAVRAATRAASGPANPVSPLED